MRSPFISIFIWGEIQQLISMENWLVFGQIVENAGNAIVVIEIYIHHIYHMMIG